MALLEQIVSMRQSGMSDVQIINTLSERGFSPMDINEALSQSKIKAAVSDDSGGAEAPEGMESEMKPSIMSSEAGPAYVSAPDQAKIRAQVPAAPMAAGAPVEISAAPEAEAYPIPAEQAAYPAQEAAYYPQEAAYAEAPAGYVQQMVDLETVKDIAAQEIEEKMKKTRDELSMLSKFRTDIKFEIQDIQNRLAKLESTITELQFSVIKKVAKYGEDIASVSEEIKATQESFSKIVGPLMTQARASNLKPISAPRIPESHESKAAKSEKPKKGKQKEAPAQAKEAKREENSEPSASFEDYFR